MRGKGEHGLNLLAYWHLEECELGHTSRPYTGREGEPEPV